MYRDEIAAVPTVLVGDFNWNAIWDKEHPRELNHSSLVKRLIDLGLVSAYHASRDEQHGREKEATYYHHRKEEKPFHIDYCFVPQGR